MSLVKVILQRLQDSVLHPIALTGKWADLEDKAHTHIQSEIVGLDDRFAGVAEESAEAAVAAAREVYRGALASPPSDGQIGQWYYDTTVKASRVFDGTTWAPAVSTSIGGWRGDDWIATAGQTRFAIPGGFDRMDVWVNGVKLTEDVDYTLESPFFDLVEAAAEGDEVSARGYFANDVVDIYTKAESNDRFVRLNGTSVMVPAGTSGQRPPAPTEGNFRLNTTTGYYEGFYGGSWKPVQGAASENTILTFEYVATDDQTTLGGLDREGKRLVYAVGTIKVYRNGVLLTNDNFSATDSLTVQLTDPADEGDLYLVEVFQAFVVANHWTKGEADARYVRHTGDGGLSFNTFEYVTNAAGQQTFSGPDRTGKTLQYMIGQTQVIVNGSELSSEDYVATNGTSIKVNSTVLPIGSIIMIRSWTPVRVADTYLRSEVDDMAYGRVVRRGAVTATSSLIIPLDADWDELVFEALGFLPATDNSTLYMQFSTDGGNTWLGLASGTAASYYQAGYYADSNGTSVGIMQAAGTAAAALGGTWGNANVVSNKLTLAVQMPDENDTTIGFEGTIIYRLNTGQRRSVHHGGTCAAAGYVAGSKPTHLRFYWNQGTFLANGKWRMLGKRW